MSSASGEHRCAWRERLDEYALGGLAASEALALEAHVSGCSDCRREIALLRPVLESFVWWPTDLLRPPASLWPALARRISAETGEEPLPSAREASEPEWEAVGSGISCKLLATDPERHVVSMLVRLAPGADYPPHTHAGLEELHLLDGELWIDDRKLHPGDYSRAEAGTADARVWSETGCTCVLVTSTRDILR